MPALGSAGRQPPYVNARASQVGASRLVPRGIGGGLLGTYLAVEGPGIVRRGVDGVVGLAEAASGVLGGRPLRETNNRMRQPGWQPPGGGAPSRPTRNNPAGPYGAAPAMPGLPPSARVVSQYPAGVATGVGGGNAGASTAAQWSAPAPAPAPTPGGARRPLPSARSAPMPGFGTPQVQISAGRGRAARLNAAAQQAGANISYDSLGNDAGIAARERSRMINEARAAGNEIPVNLTPASENYYNDADIAAWAAAKPELANKLRRDNGLPEVPRGGSAPWAPPNVTFSGELERHRSPATGYGMQASLAPGAAQAVPAQDPSFARQAVTDRTGMAFDPGLDLRAEAAPAGYRAANVPIQAAFDPNLDLMAGTAPAAYPAANVSTQIAFDPSLDLSSGRAPAPAAAQYSQAFQAPAGAQELNERYLKQIRGMRNPGMQNIGNAVFRPEAYTAGSSLF